MTADPVAGAAVGTTGEAVADDAMSAALVAGTEV